MIEITPSNHAKVLNASINKIYNRSRIKGKLDSIDLYIFNVLYNGIMHCNLELTHDQRKQLECVYRILYNTSPDICKVNGLQGLNLQRNTKFIVPPKGTPNVTPVISKVYYWQEPTPFTEYTDIVDAIINDNYLDDKPTVSKTTFEFGIDVPLTHIGRIVFVFNQSLASSSFVIKDFLGNNVTHAFTKIIIPEKKMVAFVSENVHSFGLLKILGIENQGEQGTDIFDNVFNNIFA